MVLYVLLGLMLLSWAVVGGLWVSGRLEVRWVKTCREPYPQPGRRNGRTAFYHETETRDRANPRYPAWLRGGAAGGWADERSRYRYKILVGPADAGLTANRVAFGTLVLDPHTTYPAHNHPAAEVYYILDGEAEWWVDDEKQTVRPGSVILHRPYAVHGWRCTSHKPLKAVWVWWPEGNGVAAELTCGARFTNPDRDTDEATAQPFAEPLPAIRSR